ncbi:polysaccharide biosynthesis/export protein [Gammaproteobacteria bacterium]
MQTTSDSMSERMKIILWRWCRAGEQKPWYVFGIIGMAMGLFSACASMPEAPNVATVPQVVAGGNLAMEQAYPLAVGDQLLVRFQFYNDLNDSVSVGPNGHIVLQLIGDLLVAGLSMPEATALLNKKYAEHLKKPNISLTVSAYSPQQIYVDGQVTTPGVIRSATPLTASRAIAQAGGFKLGTARTGYILLLRHTPDGKVAYYQLDFGNGVPGTDQDPLLQTNDLVFVPETAIASVADFVSNNLLKIIPFTATTSISNVGIILPH